METWYQVAVLSLGGVLGVNARYWLGVVINRWLGSQFPWATFTINVTGSFAIGLCTVVLARWLPHPHARLLVVVGFLGGYTTFSSYSLESLTLWERGEHGLCVTYMIGSVVAGFAAVVLGTAVGQGLMQSAASGAATGGQASAEANIRPQPSYPDGRAVPTSMADEPLPSANRPVHEAEEPGASS
jgi:fluoride exporter